METKERLERSSFQKVQAYMQERMRFYPWFVLPFVLLLLGQGSAPLSWSLIYPLLMGLLFFRAFDDVFCFSYDRKTKGATGYLQGSVKDIYPILLMLWPMFLSSVLIITSSLEMTAFCSFLILIHIPTYLFLRDKKAIQLVSLIKYPIFLFWIHFETGGGQWLWPLLASAFFITRELWELVHKQRSQTAELFIIVGMIVTKLSLRTIL